MPTDWRGLLVAGGDHRPAVASRDDQARQDEQDRDRRTASRSTATGRRAGPLAANQRRSASVGLVGQAPRAAAIEGHAPEAVHVLAGEVGEEHREAERDEREVQARTRSAGKPTSAPTTKHSGAATGSVSRTSSRGLTTRIPLVYAPMPKNAPWPIDTWPLNPVSRFRPIAAPAR